MPLELHIWGPAFGLPSIDPHCLASIILLQQFLPKGTWSLIASSNPDVSPFHELPALYNGTLWIAGFSNIVSFLKTESIYASDLESRLDELQQADCDAFLSFLNSRGLPLLDLSYYVSSDNYTKCTRGALADSLSWPQSWIIPQQLRNRAKNRSEHLGLNDLDVDAIREKELKGEREGLSAQIPKSLRRPTQSVSALLGSNAQQTRFRLEAVSAELFEPLEEKLGNDKWLIGDECTSVDCLAVGILTLMQVPDLPQPWLKDILHMKHSRLYQWAMNWSKDVFGLPTSCHVADRREMTASGLPWQTPKEKSWSGIGIALLDSTIGILPVIGSLLKLDQMVEYQDVTEGKTKHQQRFLAHTKMQKRQQRYQAIICACIGSTTLLGAFFYTGILSFSRSRPQPVRTSFGAAGQFFGLR